MRKKIKLCSKKQTFDLKNRGWFMQTKYGWKNMCKNGT